MFLVTNENMGLCLYNPENRQWWPSSLERVSNSSRRSLKDPGSNPFSRHENIPTFGSSQKELGCKIRWSKKKFKYAIVPLNIKAFH